MNKQEALELILTVCRKWERTDSEVRREDVEVEQVFSAIAEATRDLELLLRAQPSRRTEFQVRQRLATLGAAALWLLVDEVEVVEGKTLEEWLKEPGNREAAGLVKKVGSALLAAGYEPTPVNGVTSLPHKPNVHYGPPGLSPPQVIVIGEDGRARRA